MRALRLVAGALLALVLSGSGAPALDPGRAPATVTGGGPVLRADGVSRRMPERTLALTFNDGPDPEWTPKVLEVLARYGAHATFFVVGEHVAAHPELARRILAEGHELGSHAFSDVELGPLPTWRQDLELGLTDRAIGGATGRQAWLFRPPCATTPAAVTARDWSTYRRAGYLITLADLDPRDADRPGVDAIVQGSTPADGAGAVVQLHDAAGDRSQTVAALEVLLPELTAKGYQFETVSGALGLPGMSAAEPGTGSWGWGLRLAAGLPTALAWLLAVSLAVVVTRRMVVRLS